MMVMMVVVTMMMMMIMKGGALLIQRYDAVAVLGTFAHTTPEDEVSIFNPLYEGN